MLIQLGRPAVSLLLLFSMDVVGCAKGPRHSEPGASSGSVVVADAGHEATATELYRQADDTLASVSPGDVQATVSYLDHPNPYVRAGALTRLSPHAPLLSTAAVRRVVQRLVDPAPLIAKQCLSYASSRRAVVGQGMMFIAAECAHNHHVTMSGLAAAVLAKAEASALASASVVALAAHRNLISELERLVRSRETELTPALQSVLVAAERSNRTAEVDAALALLANGTVGGGTPETIGALARIEERSDNARKLNALCVSLTLSYPSANKSLSPRASSGYAQLGDALRGTCPQGSPCPTPPDVLVAARRMRAAAAPLLPALVSVLDSEDESLRNSALFALTSMGEAARPAIPKIRSLLTQNASPDDVDGYDMTYLLDVIGAARPAPQSVTSAIMSAVRRYPGLFDEAAAVLVTLKANLRVSDRRILRRAYDEACADAGSIANFSFARDERCFVASENLMQLKVLPAESRQ